jgi:hypothetical protein
MVEVDCQVIKGGFLVITLALHEWNRAVLIIHLRSRNQESI